MAKVVVIGSFNMDITVFSERLPKPGETVLGGRTLQSPGGKGSNQAIAAARLGADVSFIGSVGRDGFGEEALTVHEREGVNTRGVHLADCSTGVALIVVDSDGENQIAVSPGANQEVTPAIVERSRSLIEQADVMIGQLETSPEAFMAAASIARATSTTVVLNPAPAGELPDEIWRLVDIVTPNQHELVELSAEKNESTASKTLLARGVKSVLVTRGAAGVGLVTAGGRSEDFDVVPADVVDTTGAGDAFNAGLAVGLAEGLGLEDATRLGLRNGAHAVTRAGVLDSLATRSQLNSRFPAS